MKLAKYIYQVTGAFPKQETYGLMSQMRRAAVSVPSNIAEGHIRYSRKEFLNFLRIALGSLAELETQALLSFSFGYLKQEESDHIIDLARQIIRMIRSMHSKITANNA